MTTGRAAIFTGGRPVRMPGHRAACRWKPYAGRRRRRRRSASAAPAPDAGRRGAGATALPAVAGAARLPGERAGGAPPGTCRPRPGRTSARLPGGASGRRRRGGRPQGRARRRGQRFCVSAGPPGPAGPPSPGRSPRPASTVTTIVAGAAARYRQSKPRQIAYQPSPRCSPRTMLSCAHRAPVLARKHGRHQIPQSDDSVVPPDAL